MAAVFSGGLTSTVLAADPPQTATKPTAKPAAKPKAENTVGKKGGPKYAQMDYGPFLTASFVSDPRAAYDNGPGALTGDSTARGIIVKLSDDWETGIVYDADLMRVSLGWTNGGLLLKGLIGDGGHGWSPMPSVPPLFQTPHEPGFADKSGSFKDPRPDKIAPLPPAGPLPKEWAHYNGLYRHGDKVVLSYTVNGAEVLESPSVEKSGEATAIVRTIHVEKSAGPLAVMVADVNPQYPYPARPRSRTSRRSRTATSRRPKSAASKPTWTTCTSPCWRPRARSSRRPARAGANWSRRSRSRLARTTSAS